MTSRTTGRLAGFYDKGGDALIALESLRRLQPTALRPVVSTPVLPGASLDVHIWDEGGGTFTFQTRVGDVTVLDRGVFTKSC